MHPPKHPGDVSSLLHEKIGFCYWMVSVQISNFLKNRNPDFSFD